MWAGDSVVQARGKRGSWGPAGVALALNVNGNPWKVLTEVPSALCWGLSPFMTDGRCGKEALEGSCCPSYGRSHGQFLEWQRMSSTREFKAQQDFL